MQPVSNIIPQSGGSKLDWFSDALKLFASSSDADRDKAITEATSIWIGYPLIWEVIECNPSRSDEEKYKLRSDLDYAHCRATERLMMEAERVGIDPGPLLEEHRVCLEIFKTIRGKHTPSKCYGVQRFHHPNRVSDNWPDCLGERRYSLPPAMQ